MKPVDLVNIVDGEIRIPQATKKGYIVVEPLSTVDLSFPSSKTIYTKS